MTFAASRWGCCGDAGIHIDSRSRRHGNRPLNPQHRATGVPTIATALASKRPTGRDCEPSASDKFRLMGHALMENYCGFIVDACLSQANGHPERLDALALLEPYRPTGPHSARRRRCADRRYRLTDAFLARYPFGSCAHEKIQTAATMGRRSLSRLSVKTVAARSQ